MGVPGKENVEEKNSMVGHIWANILLLLCSNHTVIDRPGVAGAVVQTALS